MSAPPFSYSSGPRNAKIAFVGEAWNEQDAALKRSFIGSGGQELTRMLRDAGIHRHEAFLTSVFALRPNDKNDVTKLFISRTEGGLTTLPPITKGKYLDPRYWSEVERLRDELSAVRPNLVVALGNTAAWALLGVTGITNLRGTTAPSTLVPGLKVLPTYNPSMILRQWANRPIAIADFMKARREMQFPEIRRPERWVLVDPTLEELRQYLYDPTGQLKPPSRGYFSTDTETKRRQITMIGFAPNETLSIVIPFVDLRHPDGSYWPTHADELVAWQMAKEILESPHPKLFQNGLYDLQYIVQMGIRPFNVLEDTMLLHHALYPELPKSLAFMGSTQTDEPAWKLMARSKDEMFKKDE